MERDFFSMVIYLDNIIYLCYVRSLSNIDKGDRKVTETTKKIQEHLLSIQDIPYRDFHAKLMPNIDKERIIGIRVPILRAYAKEVRKTMCIEEFLKDLPHQYYEENNLHAFLIGETKDYDTCLLQMEEFLPYIDNWATCDAGAPKVFAKHRKELLPHIKKWISSERTYTIRFGINMLMRLFLAEEFEIKYAKMVAEIKSEEYYVNMMIAWYFATALAKQYDAIVPFLEQSVLERWTHNKTIQKACESYRITPEQKKYLRTLKIIK